MPLVQQQDLAELVAQVNTITVVTEDQAGSIDVRSKLSALWERVALIFSPKVEALVTEANRIKISNQSTYDAATGCLKAIKGTRMDVDQFKAIPDRLHSLWKLNLAEWQKHDSALNAAESSLKVQLIAFDRKKQQEEDAKRAALEAEARKKAQDDADRRAKEAKKAGASSTEVAEIKKSAEFVPPPEMKPNLERAAGTSVRENWQCEVIEFQKLLAYIVSGNAEYKIRHPELLNVIAVNESALRNMAKSQKSNMQIPGVKAYDKGSFATSAW